MSKQKNNSETSFCDVVPIFYIDISTNHLESIDFQRFGQTWTNPNARHKIKDKKIFNSYSEAMKKLPNCGANGLVLYEMLKNDFKIEPEKKQVWTLEELLHFYALIDSNNSLAYVQETKLNNPSLYKILTYMFEEGDSISHKSSWTPEETSLLQQVICSELLFEHASIDEKQHYKLFSKACDSIISQLNDD